MLKDLSKDLIKAVAQINQKSREAYVAEQAVMQSKQAAKQMKMPGVAAPKADPAAAAGAATMAKKNVKEEAEGTTPKTASEKKLAAMRPPKDKITHGDVLHGRGVRKEEAEQTQESMADVMKAVHANKGTGMFDKKVIKPGVTQYTRKSSTFTDGGKDTDMKKADKKMKSEAMDTPGNSTHQCAIHVKSEQFGEGRTLTSQHADPDANGNIAWYDVMFAEGIKRVETKDIEVLVSEGHMDHKKKKM